MDLAGEGLLHSNFLIVEAERGWFHKAEISMHVAFVGLASWLAIDKHPRILI